MQRHRVTWNGLIGLPGVSTFYADDSDPGFSGLLHAFFETIANVIPAPCAIQVESAGDVLTPATGVLTGVFENDPEGVIICTGGGPYAAPAGALVRWKTSGVAGGRHIQGHTFIVPVVSSGYESNGTLTEGVKTILRDAASALVSDAGPSMKVWRKPFAATPAWTDAGGRVHAARPAHPGVDAEVTSSQVPDKVAILASRRQ